VLEVAKHTKVKVNADLNLSQILKAKRPVKLYKIVAAYQTAWLQKIIYPARPGAHTTVKAADVIDHLIL
ncbi:hypothetical protein HDU98_006861, partial [Podochytrium sp. JEL0797]